MPAIDTTYEETCGPDWKAVAGPGRVFVMNDDPAESLLWAIGGATAPAFARGYALPPRHGSRSDAEAVIVPEGRKLWLRSSRNAGPATHSVLLTVATLP